MKYAKTGGDNVKFDAFEWENKFQLTETGKYPVDVGLIIEIELPSNRDEGTELKVGPLFQTEFGKLQLNANVLFETLQRRRLHLNSNRLPVAGEVPLAARLRIRAAGLWRHRPLERSGRIPRPVPQAGPGHFRQVSCGDRQFIKYNAAWLFGVTDAAPDNTFRMQVEYEF